MTKIFVLVVEPLSGPGKPPPDFSDLYYFIFFIYFDDLFLVVRLIQYLYLRYSLMFSNYLPVLIFVLTCGIVFALGFVAKLSNP